MKLTIIAVTIALCLLTGFALADSGVPQTPETQGFVTSTAMQAVGTATETDNLVWLMTNDGIDGLGGIPPLQPLYASIYSMTYSEDTIADQGLITYTKQGFVDTQGMVEGQWNVDMEKVVEFVGLDTGRMISAEEQVLDGAGSPYQTAQVFICPFAQTQSFYLPSFCNIVQEGSSVDLTLGSLATVAEERHVTPSAGYWDEKPGWDLPVSDNGVEMNYQVKLTGFGDIPAMGSADAYINVHVQEGRALGSLAVAPVEDALESDGRGYWDPKAEDLTYSEDTTAAGDITLFQKVMSYNSKLTGGPGVRSST
jgi:hypothetical protein